MGAGSHAGSPQVIPPGSPCPPPPGAPPPERIALPHGPQVRHQLQRLPVLHHKLVHVHGGEGQLRTRQQVARVPHLHLQHTAAAGRLTGGRGGGELGGWVGRWGRGELLVLLSGVGQGQRTASLLHPDK